MFMPSSGAPVNATSTMLPESALALISENALTITSTSPVVLNSKLTGLFWLLGIGSLVGLEVPTWTPLTHTTHPFSAPIFKVRPTARTSIRRRSQMFDRMGDQVLEVENGSSPPCCQPEVGTVKSAQPVFGSA